MGFQRLANSSSPPLGRGPSICFGNSLSSSSPASLAHAEGGTGPGAGPQARERDGHVHTTATVSACGIRDCSALSQQEVLEDDNNSWEFSTGKRQSLSTIITKAEKVEKFDVQGAATSSEPQQMASSSSSSSTHNIISNNLSPKEKRLSLSKSMFGRKNMRGSLRVSRKSAWPIEDEKGHSSPLHFSQKEHTDDHPSDTTHRIAGDISKSTKVTAPCL